MPPAPTLAGRPHPPTRHRFPRRLRRQRRLPRSPRLRPAPPPTLQLHPMPYSLALPAPPLPWPASHAPRLPQARVQPQPPQPSAKLPANRLWCSPPPAAPRPAAAAALAPALAPGPPTQPSFRYFALPNRTAGLPAALGRRRPAPPLLRRRQVRLHSPAGAGRTRGRACGLKQIEY